jgi:hypothetical protein
MNRDDDADECNIRAIDDCNLRFSISTARRRIRVEYTEEMEGAYLENYQSLEASYPSADHRNSITQQHHSSRC